MRKEKLTFKNSKGQTLVGILFSPQNKKNFPIAIFCHGYKSSKDSPKAIALSNSLPEKGIGLFAFDFSGSGGSDGKFEDSNFTDHIDDLKSCVDFISGYTHKIAIIGSSLGGIASLQESSKDKRISALILISTVSQFPWKNTKEFEDIKKWKEEGYTYTHSVRFGQMKLNYKFYEEGIKYNNLEDYNSISIPTLILHGDKDLTVDHSKRLTNFIKNSKLVILKDADHNYTNPSDFNKVINTTIDFLSENLK